MSLTSNLLLLVIAILNACYEDRRLIRKDEAPWLKVLVSCVEHSVEHAFVEKKVPHPLRDDDIYFWHGHLDLLHLALEQADLGGHAVGFHNLASLLDDGGHVHADDMLGACFHGKPGAVSRERGAEALLAKAGSHAEDGSAAADVQHDFVFEEMLILVDGISVRLRSDFIFLELVILNTRTLLSGKL